MNKKHRKRQQERSRQKRRNTVPAPPMKLGEQERSQVEDRQGSRDETRAANEHQQVSAIRSAIRWAGVRATRYSAVITAFFTAVLAWVGFMQYTIYSRQLDLTENQVRVIQSDQRPWFSFDTDVKESDPFDHFIIKSYGRDDGKTPALRITVKVYYEVRTLDEPPKLEGNPASEIIETVIGVMYPHQ